MGSSASDAHAGSSAVEEAAMGEATGSAAVGGAAAAIIPWCGRESLSVTLLYSYLPQTLAVGFSSSMAHRPSDPAGPPPLGQVVSAHEARTDPRALPPLVLTAPVPWSRR